MEALYFDFEFRDNESKEALVLLSWMTSPERQPVLIDLRSAGGRSQVHQVSDSHRDYTWIAYNAQADLKCLLALGIDIQPLKVIDAMAEARMVTMTHQDYWSESQSLLSSLKAFSIPTETDEFEKDQIRDLILSRTAYSAAEWRAICRYGPSDITPLPGLMERVSRVHSQLYSPITLDEMVQRGEYVKAVAELSFRSRGFPIDEARLQHVYGNSQGFRQALIEGAVAEYGPIFWDDYSWSHEGFREMVDAHGFAWETTESGLLRLDKDYFKAQARRYPELEPLHQIRNLLRALMGTDLRSRLSNGHIKPSVFTFSQKTGRNSPKPSQGFVLNLPPWLRTMVRPKSGRLFVGADWSQQEIAIAAGLSGDENLLAAYNNPEGDVYLTLAKMAGAVPPDGTKQSHPIERKTFKAIQLGLGYGKGVKSLAIDVYEANRGPDGKPLLTHEGALARAEELYEWHQETFLIYWEWLRDSIRQARIDEYFRSVDGWTYYVNDRVRHTQLLNYPLQSAGAAMMRRATIRIADTRRLDLVCSLHDAFYINCRESDEEEHVKLLTDCMDEACKDILGTRVRVPVDIGIYNANTGYRDPRADRIDKMLGGLLSHRRAELANRDPAIG